MVQTLSNVFIVSTVRTPIGKYGRSLRNFSAVELGSIVIKEVIKRAGLEPQDIEFYIMGQVIQAGCGQNPARLAAIKAGIPPEIGGFTVNQVCASGLVAVILGAELIKSRKCDIVIAGGMESMSRAPFLISADARWGLRFVPKALGGYTLIDSMTCDGLWDHIYDKVMGCLAEETAKKYGITRQDADYFAYHSHMRAAKATKNGEFKKEIIPIKTSPTTILDYDEGIRPDTSLEKLAKLKPVFAQDGIITAGNASQLSDGAAALILASEKAIKEHDLKPLAKIVDWELYFNDPKDFLEAPVHSIKRLLERNHLKIDDIDYYEVNEAFAITNALVTKLLKVPHEKLNIRGGAVALGHPIGCSGARILVTLINILHDYDGKRGVASICHGGGGAASLIIETIK